MTTLPRLWTFDISPFAGRVRVAFAEKGVEIALHEIHPKDRPPAIRDLSPIARVPILETQDGAIFESSVICEWIEETYPDPPLWPADAVARGWARGWTKWIDDQLNVNYFLGMRKQVFGRDPDDPEDITERLHKTFISRLGRFEETLDVHEGPWLCGEMFTYADLGAMALAVRLPQWSPHLVERVDAHPRTAAWLAALRDRPSAAAIDAKGDPVHRGTEKTATGSSTE